MNMCSHFIQMNSRAKHDGAKDMSDKEKSAIEHCILHDDGSCRDINMDDMDIQVARQIAFLLLQSFEFKRGISQAGDELAGEMAHAQLDAEFSRSSNTLHLILESDKNLLSHLQMFFHWEQPATVSLELTFFPKDVGRPFTLELFKDLLEPILNLAQPANYYVRYENAGWTYGDTSERSGVIYCEQRAHRQSDEWA